MSAPTFETIFGVKGEEKVRAWFREEMALSSQLEKQEARAAAAAKKQADEVAAARKKSLNLDTLKGQLQDTAGLFKIAVPAFSIYEGTRAFKSLIAEADHFAKSIGSAAKMTGFSTEELSVWGYAAVKAGKDIEDLNKPLIKLSQLIGNVRRGDAKAQSLVAQLFGGKTDALKGLSQDQALEAITKRIADAPKEIRTSLAMDVVGKSGGEALPFLIKLGEHFDELKEKAHEAGLIVGQEMVDGLKKNKEAMQELHARSLGVALQFESGLLPALGQASNALVNAASAGGDVGVGFKKVGEGIGSIAKGIVAACSGAAAGIAWLVARTESAIEGLTDKRSRIQQVIDEMDARVRKNGGKSDRSYLQQVDDRGHLMLGNHLTDALFLRGGYTDNAGMAKIQQILKESKQTQEEKAKAINDSIDQSLSETLQKLYGPKQKVSQDVLDQILGKDFVKRRDAILKDLKSKKLLTEDLKSQIMEVQSMPELESIYQKAVEGYTRKKAHDYAAEIKNATREANRARIDAEKQIQEELTRTAMDGEKQRFEQSKLLRSDQETYSTEAFYRDRRKELSSGQSAQYKVLAAQFADVTGTTSETTDAVGLSKVVDARLSALRGQVPGKGADEIARQKQIGDLEKLRVDLVKEQEDGKRKILELETQYQDQLKKDQQKKYREALEAYNAEMEGYKQKVQAQEDAYARGKQSRYQTDQNIQKIGVASQDALGGRLETLRGTATNPEEVDTVNKLTDAQQRWTQSTLETKQAMNGLKTTIGDMMVSGLTNFFMDIGTGAKNVGDAFREMALNFVLSMAQMITQALMMKAVFTMLGMPMPSGNPITALFSQGGQVQQTQYRATGGPIFQARGTDTVPAMLTPGEQVLRKSSVDTFPDGMLDDINNMGSAAIQRWVPPTPVPVAAGSAGLVQAHLTVEHDPAVIVREASRHLESPEGVRMQTRIMERNAKGFRSALKVTG